MIGLLFFGALALWCLVALLLSLMVLLMLSGYRMRWPLASLVFAGLLVLPLMDDISGGREFAALCEAKATIDVDRGKAAGRTVYAKSGEWKEIPGTLLPVHALQVDYIDIATGERVLGYRELTAGGGWLSEALKFSETRMPLTFEGSCNPARGGGLEALFRELGITLARDPAPGRA